MYKGKNKNPKTTKVPEPPEQQLHQQRKTMIAQQPYVEDVGEDRNYEPWNSSAGHTEDERSPAEPLPEAPIPPPAATEEHINVFDCLVATG